MALAQPWSAVGVNLAARWHRRPEAVKQVMVEWLGYQLDNLLVGELALGE
jgi:hypothetical protein